MADEQPEYWSAVADKYDRVVIRDSSRASNIPVEYVRATKV